MSGPLWRFNGRSYLTIAGLGNALLRDAHADSHSCVTRERVIHCYRGRDQIPVATYSVDAPRLGYPMHVARVQP